MSNENEMEDGVEMDGEWDARCDVTLTYKGKELKGWWDSDSGYNLYNDDETEAVTDAMDEDEQDALWDWLSELPQPRLTLEEK